MTNTKKPRSTSESNILTPAWWNSISGVVAAIGTLAALVGLGFAYVALPHLKPAPPSELERTPALSIEFWQDGPAPMKMGTRPKGNYVPRTVVKLKSAPFKIRLSKLTGELGVAFNAWRDDSLFNLKSSSDVDDLDYASLFKNGTYLATLGHQADSFLSLTKDSYSFLSSENTNSLGNDKFENDYYQVNNPPDRVAGFNAPSSRDPFNFPNEVDTAKDLHDLTSWHNDIYLVAWKDLNLNHVIDDDEYEYITLDFPDK